MAVLKIMLLALLASCLVSWFLVQIKMFKHEESAVHGVLGLVTCGLYAFLWGWMRHKEHNLSNIMLIWSVCAALVSALHIVIRAQT